MNIWAHRGCSGRFPENTITSFTEALKYDITGIELDIQLTKDRHIVVIHDETVDRTTSGEGNVADYTFDDIRALRIEAPGGKTERIPTIDEIFDLMERPCKERGLKINIELKNSKVRYEGMEQMILDKVRKRGFEDHVIYSSFCADSVRLMKELDPHIHIGILAAQCSECLELLPETNADAIHPLVNWIDVEDLSQKISIPVRGWNLGGFEPLYPSTDPLETTDVEQARRNGVTDIITTYPELYADPLYEKSALDEVLFFRGIAVDPETGMITAAPSSNIPEDSGAAAPAEVYTNREPIFVRAGTRFDWKDDPETGYPGYGYKLYRYSTDVDPDLMYTYKYDDESNWTTYMKPDTEEAAGKEIMNSSFLFDEDCYFRLSVFQKDAGDLFDDLLGDDTCVLEGKLFDLERPNAGYVWPDHLREEVRRVSEKLKLVREPGDTVLFVVADNHYVTNGNWEDTAYDIKMAARECRPDAIVHLGDMTDGVLPAELTKQFTGRVIRDLKRACPEVCCCVGNHDHNYFRNNPDRFTRAAAADIFGAEKDCFYHDLDMQKVRMVFLGSFDPDEKDRNKRYGYSSRAVSRLRKAVSSMPEGYRAIVFSHTPVLSWMHYWSDSIKNGDRIMKVLARAQKASGNILCFMHGHNHADQIVTQDGVPVISVGSSKIESFEDKKPDGAMVFERRPGDVTQDLWDIVRISRNGKNIDLIRFGAGEDRHITACSVTDK